MCCCCSERPPPCTSCSGEQQGHPSTHPPTYSLHCTAICNYKELSPPCTSCSGEQGHPLPPWPHLAPRHATRRHASLHPKPSPTPPQPACSARCRAPRHASPHPKPSPTAPQPVCCARSAMLRSKKPEAEARLLSSLINKLGDPDRKLASKVGRLSTGCVQMCFFYLCF